MHALVDKSLIDAPQILLTAVSTFSVGFLLWFLFGLLRETRRMRAAQVHIFRFTGGRVLKFEHRRRRGAVATPAVALGHLTREAGQVQVSSTPDRRSPNDAVKMRWLVLFFLWTTTVCGLQTPPWPSPLAHAAVLPSSPVPAMVGWPIRQVETEPDPQPNNRARLDPKLSLARASQAGNGALGEIGTDQRWKRSQSSVERAALL